MLFIFLSLFPLFFLVGEEFQYQEPKGVATTEGLPSNFVNQSVCVISGEYTDVVQDIVLAGPEPLVIQRTYSSQGRGGLGRGWSFNHHEKLIVGHAVYDKKEPILIMALRQPSGAQLDYIYPRSKEALKKKDLQFRLLIPKGLTNGATTLSGRTNLRNQEVHFYPESETIVSISGAGNRRTFVKTARTEEGWPVCSQKKEEKVNGSLYKYEGKGKEWDRRISCQSRQTGTFYNDVRFKRIELSERDPLVMIASDGREFKYHFRRHKTKIKEGNWLDNKTHHIESFYLTKTDHPYGPLEHYEYGQKALSKELQITCKRRMDGRFLQTEYYHRGPNALGGSVGFIDIKEEDDYRLDRVKRQRAPVGTDGKPITTHRFVYHCKVKKRKGDHSQELLEGTTDVYDAYHHRVHYAYNRGHRLTSMIRYTGTSSYVPYSSESFLWGQGEEEGNLLGKIFKDGEGTVHHATYYTYDAKGNVLTSSLCGKLSGETAPNLVLDASEIPLENGYERECKTYTYSDNGLNLLLSETDSRGKTILYRYIKGTDRVKAKYVKEGDQIQLREFYTYDDHYVLTKKVMDDGKHLSEADLRGVTERRLIKIIPRQTPPLGLPQWVEESEVDVSKGEQKLLSSANFDYSPEGRLLKKEVFDADQHLAYALHWKYDAHGNVIQETDALGQVVIRKYDDNDNLIHQQGPSSDMSLQNTYDFANRLIAQEEIHTDGKRWTTTHAYDYLGNCVATVDPYGHETRRVFDDFGRVISVHYPPVANETDQLVHPMVSKTYDIGGYPISLTNAKGETTQTEYNIRGQPIQRIHPNGAKERWVYHVDGQLAQSVDKQGTRTVYDRDFLGRITSERVYAAEGALLKQTQHVYNALHLLQSIDAEGGEISYAYDGAGRLEWIRQGERQEQNRYDSLGRLAEVREWFGAEEHEYRATIKVYDLLNRVLEERVQASNGTLLRFSRYEYDAKGNRTFVETGDQQTGTVFDAHNNPIKITNALGHATHTVYNTEYINSHGQKVLQTTTTDPLGYQITHTYDTANRLVETSRCNPFGVKVGRQTIFYDLSGNRACLSEEIIEEGEKKRTIQTLYSYDSDHQLTTLTEAAGMPEQKITRTTYTASGQKETCIKPNGTLLFYDYDPLGRLKGFTSSDGSIAYSYEYNLRDQVTRVVDLRSNQVTELTYDSLGQLMRETLGHGLSIDYAYDRIGRVRSLLFPDQTGVEYIYDAANLKEIHRLIEGERAYSHVDEDHTLAGHVMRSRLPGHQAEVNYAYDPLGRCTKIESAEYQQAIPAQGFDAAGNLLEFMAQGKHYRFTYDDHYQLNSEEGHVSHAYRFDSLFNRTLKDGEEHLHNGLNQLLHNRREQLSYDANGNLIHRVQHNQAIHYHYDALDRLIAVDREGKTFHYVYDPFHRRLVKRQEGKEDQLFVYQGQEEIGRWEKGAFQELRLLSKQARYPMVALEVNGNRYVPLHDLSSHVVVLLDHQGHVLERYRYTAFGEREVWAPGGERLATSVMGNPWQYASKRLDQETGLIAFGLRDYDVQLGRWITPDPAGDADGSNLYAYVHNSPLLYRDPLGLYKVPASTGLTGLASPFIFDFSYRAASMGYCAWQNLNPSTDTPQVQHIAIEDDLEGRHHAKQSVCKKSFERTKTYSLNEGLFINPATNTPFTLQESPDKGIGFIGGIKNSFLDFKENMCYLGQLSEQNIQGVHCPSFGLMTDTSCYIQAIRKNIAYEGVRELHRMWQHYFKHCPTDATFLTICHSRGVVYVRNALMSFPPELRKRIEVIAIAPGGYIDPVFCKRVKHYESQADFIPLLDMAGRQRYRETIISLEPHKDANPWFDHSFSSPTYRSVLREGIEKYNVR